MGSLNKGIFNGVGLLSALLFLVAGAMVLMSGDSVTASTNSSALYVAAGAGVLTVVTGVLVLMERKDTMKTLFGVFGVLAGVIFVASAFVSGSADILFLAAGIMATLAILMDMLAKWNSKVVGAMYISAAFTAAELCVSVLSYVNGSPTYAGLVALVFGLWIAVDIVIAMMLPEKDAPKTRLVVNDKVAEKKEPELARNTKGTKKAKAKPAEKPKDEPKKDVKSPAKEQPKAAPKAASREESKQETKAESKAEPKKEPAPAPKAESVPEPKKEEPAPAPKEQSKPNNDFMSKLVSSRNVQSMAKKDAPVSAEVPKKEPAPAPKAEPVPEPKKEEPAPAPVSEEIREPEEKTSEEPVPEPVEEPVPEPVEEPVPEPVEEPEEVPEEEPVAEPEELPETLEDDEEPAVAEEPQIQDVIEEPEPVVEEMPEPVEEPEPVVPAEDPVPVVEDTSEPVPEPVPEPVEEPAEEPAAKPEEEPAPEPVVDESEPSHEDDMFTDYSPEAVVRRAAWNKGLRCRRDYGEHQIPVAFVKGKVAVFVKPADDDASIDDVLRSEGWTVLRYDEALVTDGAEQGEEIAAAVKTNLREAKAAAKKKKKTAKK